MTKRFWQAGLDSRIMEAASQFKLSVYRDADGDLSGSFELQGDFGALCGDDSGALNATDGMQLVADLLREFKRGRPGAGGAFTT